MRRGICSLQDVYGKKAAYRSRMASASLRCNALARNRPTSGNFHGSRIHSPKQYLRAESTSPMNIEEIAGQLARVGRLSFTKIKRPGIPRPCGFLRFDDQARFLLLPEHLTECSLGIAAVRKSHLRHAPTAVGATRVQVVLSRTELLPSFSFDDLPEKRKLQLTRVESMRRSGGDAILILGFYMPSDINPEIPCHDYDEADGKQTEKANIRC